MELVTVKSRAIFPHAGHHATLPPILVEGLLAMILPDDKEEILVEGSSKNFLYDTKTSVNMGKSRKENVLEVEVNQREGTIETNLSGNIETAEGLQLTYNLYFFMWLDHTQTSPLKNHDLQSLRSVSLPIHQASLSDSVFELDLYRRKKIQQREHFGQGRGYLVFLETS